MFDNNFWTGVKRYRDNIFIFMTRGSFNTRRVLFNQLFLKFNCAALTTRSY